MKGALIYLAALFLLVSANAFGDQIVFENTTTDTLDTLVYASNGFTQIGDQIQLGGIARQATSAVIQFYNAGSAGTFDATLRLFNVGAPVGAQIGSDFVLSDVSVPANDILNVQFALPFLLVPEKLIFTASVANPSVGVDILGLDLFEPPTIGSSDNSFAIANNGTSFEQVGTASNNVYFQLSAVPEPSTIVLLATALPFILLLYRRSAKRSRS